MRLSPFTAAVALACLATACNTPRGRGGPGRGRLTFEIRDADGALIPGRVTLVGVGVTPDPVLGDGAAGTVEGHTLLADNTIRTLDGAGEVAVAPGVYDVYVSRGIEWTRVVVPKVDVGAARGASVRATLAHVVETPGWSSGDFHVHAAPSWDSDIGLDARVIEFAAEGIDLIVATDHNIVTDYAPSIAALGADPLLASLIGDELTTRTWGHFGAYPLPRATVGQPYGASWREGATARDVIEGVKRDHPGVLVQANHPRRAAQGSFTVARFDRATATPRDPGFSLGFDTIELLNGGDTLRLDPVLADWFALLDHGVAKTAMGNSDSHGLTGLAGYPRNLVRVDDAHDADAVVRAVREHHSLFTTGPILELTCGAAGIGDVVRAVGGKVTVDLRVRAAPWISVSSVTLYVDGVATQEWNVPRGEAVDRFTATETIAVTRDATIVLRADGLDSLAPVVGNDEHGEVLPLAITNPLFVDADGDGRWRDVRP